MALPALLARLAGGAAIRGGNDVAENVPSGVSVNVGMSVSMNSKALERRLKMLEKKLPQKIDNALSKTAQKGAEIITQKASRGLGAFAPFVAYSDEYAKAKREGWERTASRPAFSGDASGRVNLMVTGRMWAALTTSKRRGYAVIYFRGAEEAKKAFYNNERREFMGFNRTSQKRLFKIFQREVFK